MKKIFSKGWLQQTIKSYGFFTELPKTSSSAVKKDELNHLSHLAKEPQINSTRVSEEEKQNLLRDLEEAKKNQTFSAY